jgi:hypothetical protein
VVIPDFDDSRSSVIDLIRQITTAPRAVTPSELEHLRRHFARHVLPLQPTPRVLTKHGKHVEDDGQWPDDVSPDEYLESLRETMLSISSSIYLAEAEIERTWTIYFVGPVRYRWRGRHAGSRVVVLFNAERFFWITGFQAEAGDTYVDRQDGFWAHTSR